MKRIISAIVVAVFLLATQAPSFAQAATKIGYVDLSRIFDEYQKTGSYDKVMEDKNVKYQKERNKKLERIQEDERKLALLKEEERTKLRSRIEKDRNDLLQFDRQQQTDLRRERDEKIREILLEIEGVVKNFAEQEKYDLILNDRVLIYGNKAIEITDRIIDGLNKKK